jgi:cystathionine beta-lyase/cystathionine gamma-synthase
VVDRVLSRTQLFQLAESLGGVESLISYPETMSHASMDEPARRAAGITAGMLRVSCGIEHPDDLCADLSDALS